MDEGEIRGLIVSEVAAQMKPVMAEIAKVHDWQTGWWANGSGKPPGFFQMWMAEDEKRNVVVDDFIKTAQKRQIEDEDRTKQREARWNFWWPIIKWVGGGAATALLALVCWLGPKAVHVGIILTQDYLKTHPEAAQKINSASASSGAIQSTQKSQDAGLPYPR